CVRLINRVAVAGRLGDLGRGEEGASVFKRAVPVAVLERIAFGLLDPLRGDPRPAGLRLGPVAGLPDDAVAVGEVLTRDVEVIGARRLAGLVGRVLGGGAVLAEVEPVGLAVGPEP